MHMNAQMERHFVQNFSKIFRVFFLKLKLCAPSRACTKAARSLLRTVAPETPALCEYTVYLDRFEFGLGNCSGSTVGLQG